MAAPVKPVRPARLPLFGVASVPYGAFNGFVAVALPYLLRRQGLSVERIAGVSALVQIPAIWYFLWAPVVDVGPPRRAWIVILSVASALCTSAALVPAASIYLLTALLIAASVFNQPVSSAIGGLVASVVPNELRGRTGGWSQAGILGAGVLTGAIGVWAIGQHVRAILPVVVAALIAVPSFAALAIPEPPVSRPPLAVHLRRMWTEMLTLLRRREIWLGVVFFVSPIGAGALMNLFSALASDFHATPSTVLIVVAAAGIATPIGALAGGRACDRFDRWRVYPVAGLIQAATVAAMRFAPLTPATYMVGAVAYAFATGMCYAAFMALAFDLLGPGTASSGTAFTLFMASANLPIVYMLRIDGFAHDHFGVRAMLAVDAASNILVAIPFLLAVGALRRAARIENS